MAANNSNLFPEGMKTLPQRLSWETEHAKLNCPPAKLSFCTDVLLCDPELGNRTGRGPLNSQSTRVDHWTRSDTPVPQVLAHRIPKGSRKETVSLPSGLVLNATTATAALGALPGGQPTPQARPQPRLLTPLLAPKVQGRGVLHFPGADADLSFSISALAPRWSRLPGATWLLPREGRQRSAPRASATSTQPAGDAGGRRGRGLACAHAPSSWIGRSCHLPTSMPPSFKARPGFLTPETLP